jgi:hypothetical protein
VGFYASPARAGHAESQVPIATTVRLLWHDRVTLWPLSELDRELPDVPRPATICAIEVNPGAHQWRDVSRKYAVRDWRLRDPDPDRSRATFRFAVFLINRGATPDELACALLAFPPYLSKRGTDMHALAAEVSRLWAKLKGDPET